MKSHSQTIVLVMLVLVVFCSPYANKSYAAQEPAKPDAAQSSEQEGIEVDDEELAAYNAAKDEKDYDTRATKLLEFIAKYPKTQLKSHFEYEYKSLISLCHKEEKWEVLQSVIEKWLKAYPDAPNRMDLTAMNAQASEKLGNFSKCAECLEEIYAKEPKNSLILSIFNAYQKANNLAKQLTWADKLLQTPEYAGYYWIPRDFVRTYTNSNNTKEADAWLSKTMKAIEAAKDLTPEQQQDVKEVKLYAYSKNAQAACDAGKSRQCIDEYGKVLKLKKTCAAYLNIGIAQWKQKDVDNALESLAKAELMEDKECSAEAKKQVETLYSSQHDGRLTGIEKLYKRIKEEMGK
jgi:hypothetical protein